MLFYCYSEVTDSTIESRLGDADYSYYFVLKFYIPLLEKIGSVQIVNRLDEAFVAECRQTVGEGKECYLLAFAPPHKIPYDLPCPVIPVFAWEYSSIPNREFISDPRDSWCYALEHFGQALTHSSYAKQVVKHDIHQDFPIECIPAPLWDTCKTLREQSSSRSAIKNCSITLGTAVIDSRDFTIESESIAPANRIARPVNPASTEQDSCNNIHIEFGQSNPDVWMVGFYPAEPWGAWSKTSSPWIMLPSVVSGLVRIRISMNAHGKNAGRTINMQIGDQCIALEPKIEMSEFEFELEIHQPSNFIAFSNLDLSAKRSPTDPRTIAIGLGSLSIESLSQKASSENTAPQANVVEHEIVLSGVVYTSILNPRDGRKNWEDIVTAFCLAFRDRSDVTLILKMTYKDMSGYLEDVFALLCQLHPFQCRIVVVHGYISSQEYASLITSTSFIVNASRSEGQCLPLMEYMSCGIPAIAPDNTAMADYINSDNAFIVESSPEPHYWPHDPQQIFTTLWYRPSWESLHAAYLNSYAVACGDPQEYAAMSKHAWQSQFEYCSSEKLAVRLEAFLKRIREQ